MTDETKIDGKHDETVAGGRFISGDIYVDAFGKEIGKVEKPANKTEQKEKPVGK